MNRPRINIPLTPIDYLLEVLALLALIALIAIPALYFSELPTYIPSHFGAAGRPNAVSPKVSIWLFPAIGLFVYLMLTILTRFPHRLNYPVEITEQNAAYQYKNVIRLTRWMKAFILLAFGYISFRTIKTAMGEVDGLGAYFTPLFLGLVVFVVALFVARAIYFRSR